MTAATSRNSLYDHPRSQSSQTAQRAWQKRPADDAAEQRAAERDRNEIYNAVSSRQHRADQAADRRGTAGNRVAELRQTHRHQVTELAERHRAEGHALHAKHSRDRSRDPHMAAGLSSQPGRGSRGADTTRLKTLTRGAFTGLGRPAQRAAICTPSHWRLARMGRPRRLMRCACVTKVVRFPKRTER
jgi:hypothetical protein